ncbi:MAG: pentapeptide repeat-containing protein [candidate division Zixibacteria bacterium]|nr:pentapeptide repeat-containing protein [candidate division Zixibacteria bacterium]
MKRARDYAIRAILVVAVGISSQSATVQGTTFKRINDNPEPSDIINAISKGHSVFLKNCTIEGNLCCSNEIRGELGFLDCNFLDDVDFSRAKFYGKLHCVGIHFKGNVRFESSVFSSVDSSNSPFGQLTRKGDVELDQLVRFKRCTFHKKVCFINAVFNDSTSFCAVEFLDDVSFHNTRFYRFVDFHYCEFKEGADFDSTTFDSGVNFANCLICNGSFIETTLEGAEFSDASFNHVIFEPRTMPDYSTLAEVQGLHTLTYDGNPSQLTGLYGSFFNNRYLNQSRQIKYAIRKTENEKDRQSHPFIYGLKWLFLDKTCQYGMNVWRPLGIIFGFFIIFAVSYYLIIRFGGRKNGIAVNHSGDMYSHKYPPLVKPKRIIEQRPFKKVIAFLKWESKLTYEAFFFSLINSFNISFQDFTLRRWFTLLRLNPKSIKPIGWVRPLSAIQSLATLYLWILWIFIYGKSLIE